MCWLCWWSASGWPCSRWAGSGLSGLRRSCIGASRWCLDAGCVQGSGALRGSRHGHGGRPDRWCSWSGKRGLACRPPGGLVSRGLRVGGTLSAGSDTWSRGVAVSSFELRSHQHGAGKCPSRRSRACWPPTPRVFSSVVLCGFPTTTSVSHKLTLGRWTYCGGTIPGPHGPETILRWESG